MYQLQDIVTISWGDMMEIIVYCNCSTRKDIVIFTNTIINYILKLKDYTITKDTSHPTTYNFICTIR